MIDKHTLDYIQQHLDDDVHALALKKAPTTINHTLALQQIAARQQLKKKLPAWCNNLNIVFPPNLSLEQASSQITAQYKAKLVSGHTFVDLTSGMGIDCYYFSKYFKIAHYVEMQEQLCQIAQHNYQYVAPNIEVHNTSAEQFINTIDYVDVIYIDPARRDQKGNKTVTIQDCTPNLIELLPIMLEKSSRILVKLSPMLDITLALKQLMHVAAVHVIAVDNECKELLFDIQRDHNSETQIICANLLKNNQHQISSAIGCNFEAEANIQLAEKLLRYLYEPNVAILKAGLFKSTALRFNIQKLHTCSHLSTSNTPITKFDARCFEIEQVISFNKKQLKLFTSDIK